MPWISGGSDGDRAEFLMLEVGGLFGGPNLRAGLSARFGLVTFAGTLLLRATPFVGSRGGRHGFELRLGKSLYLEDLTVGLNYAWHMPRLERKLRRHPRGPR